LRNLSYSEFISRT